MNIVLKRNKTTKNNGIPWFLAFVAALGAGCHQLTTLTNWCFQGTQGNYRTNSTPDFYFT